jgi:hypothetical protein
MIDTVMSSTCVVFATDANYLHKFVKTALSLRHEGRYTGDLCLIIGDDLYNSPILKDPLFDYLQVKLQYFPNFVFPEETLRIMASLDRPEHWFPKRFQYHKFHLFNTVFKQWRKIFYMDCGIAVLGPIQPILDCWQENTVLAHSDAYPTYEWKLRDQFVPLSPFIETLEGKYNLSIDYPQTTILLFDSALIQETTEQELYELMLQFPNSRTNDQGIVALYFTCVKPAWKQIPTGNEYINFYDYLNRGDGKPYILLKSC